MTPKYVDEIYALPAVSSAKAHLARLRDAGTSKKKPLPLQYRKIPGVSSKKRAAQFNAPLQVDRLSFKPVYCMTLVQTLSIRDCALGEQVGAKTTFKSDGGLISGADLSSSE